MKFTTVSILLGTLSVTCQAAPAPEAAPDVDTVYPYTGPAIPIGDWVDNTVNGNGEGFPRLVEPPAVTPASADVTNNVNVIALSYLPGGINIHYQTPFGLGSVPTVNWGSSAADLSSTATGESSTYDRTPPCSMYSAVTQCSQFFHDVQISGLKPSTTYYYKILAGNGTTVSNVLNFTTAQAVGDKAQFTMAVLNDMGYTNAAGTFKYLHAAADEGLAFAWHGGDLSYADDWMSGILPCESDWPVCYNGTSSELPNTPADGVLDNPDYLTPLPAGEVPNQGGPLGGDMSPIYESNWDLWQQWMSSLTLKIPYMVLPGNHEPSCGEFDGPNNELTAYLDSNTPNSTAINSSLTYYSCPPSQRNFTAYQHRFRMPGNETNGVGNFWYSFDYGLVHFIALDGETDFPSSPEWPFVRDLSGNETHPTEDETYITDSGPFGYIKGNLTENESYEQYNWLVDDLAAVDRCKTPWVIAMSHRPMYSSQVSSYQKNVRNAFESVMLKYEVDAFLSGHIHWYERMFPLTVNGTIDSASIVNNNTWYTNGGTSLTHIINGMAGNIESHSQLEDSPVLPISAYLSQTQYGFNKITVYNETAMKFQFIQGSDGSVGDELTLLKRDSGSCAVSSSNSTSSAPSTPSSSFSTSSPSGTFLPGNWNSSTTSGITTPETTVLVYETTTVCPVTLTHTSGTVTSVETGLTTSTITLTSVSTICTVCEESSTLVAPSTPATYATPAVTGISVASESQYGVTASESLGETGASVPSPSPYSESKSYPFTDAGTPTPALSTNAATEIPAASTKSTTSALSSNVPISPPSVVLASGSGSIFGRMWLCAVVMGVVGFAAYIF